MISFVIIFHPSRIENLYQTLRFLQKRENQLQELILVCQTNCLPIKSDFKTTKQINMNLETYHKTKMTNEGVRNANQNIIALLDSDRILPHNYFENTAKQLSKNQIVSSKKLFQLTSQYSDDQIELERVEKYEDFRSEDNISRRKNLFSGNTLMHKDDYWSIGGYDENYIGYGYADNDMTMKAIKSGMDIKWNESKELHLFHENKIIWKNETIEKKTFQIMTAINGLMYHLKWRLSFDSEIQSLIYEIEQRINEFPLELTNQYLKMRKMFNNLL